MKTSLLVVAGKNEDLVATALDAAGVVFPEATVTRVDSLARAMKMQIPPGPELIVLTDPTREEMQAAATAPDNRQLPRWAVIAAGENTDVPFVETVPPACWTRDMLRRALRTSLALHQLRRENAAFRGDLLSVGIRIAHDLRSPLGGIFSGVDAINDFLSDHPPEIRELTRPIADSADDLVRTISQLSLWAKASAAPAVRQDFDMGVAVDAAMERLEKKILARAATISRPLAWPKVSGDPAKTEMVWLGFIDNTLRHAGERPSVELGWRAEEAGFRFWVKDGGDGIAPEKQKNLFQPFHRLHETNAPRGLGLPIIERLVQLQGGTCGYESVPGGGACFSFSLGGADAV